MKNEDEKTTIFIADDHPVVRKGLTQAVGKDSSFSIVAECGDGNEALQKILELKPDIALLDISMPGMDGLDIIRNVHKENINIKFVILTMYDNEEYFNEAMALNVKGYLLKDTAIADVIHCLHNVSQGRHYICPALSDYLVSYNSRKEDLERANPGIENLTETERKILSLIAQNKTSKEIAAGLFISARTVQNHRYNICHKLNLHGSNKLLQFALENKDALP